MYSANYPSDFFLFMTLPWADLATLPSSMSLFWHASKYSVAEIDAQAQAEKTLPSKQTLSILLSYLLALMSGQYAQNYQNFFKNCQNWHKFVNIVTNVQPSIIFNESTHHKVFKSSPSSGINNFFRYCWKLLTSEILHLWQTLQSMTH